MMNRKYLYYLIVPFLLLATACQPDKAEQEQQQPDIVAIPQKSTTYADTIVKAEERLGKEALAAEKPAENTINKPATEREGLKDQPGKSKPKPQAQKALPQAQTPAAPAPAQGSQAFQEVSYRLERVQGESLPLVLDMTTECDTKLQKATLSLRNGRFQFQSNSTVECGGQITQQEKHEATGSYKLENNQIYLTVETGEMLGDAVGLVEGNSIRLQQISNDEEQQEVDWLFSKQ